MKKVSFYTLGCKLNQAETSYLADQFDAEGYRIVPFGEECDICVINTCTVTARTDYKCRQAIRKALKKSPGAKVAVVGCYAQVAGEQLKTIPGVNIILGSDQKFKLLDYLAEEEQFIQKKGENREFFSQGPGDVRTQTRAFLKIQDGCNNFCSYCIVPYARGRSRSDTPTHVTEMATQLVAKGYREIVLTGVHIGAYGHDLQPRWSLTSLLQKLIEIPGLGRLRLSSLDPHEIDDDLIEMVAQSGKICPHFHIALQSGDDYILKRMKRNYRVSDYVKIIDKLVNRIKAPGLGTDIIVGFPGEEEKHFRNSYRLVQELPFSYLHVFSFSAREGTAAFKFTDRVAPQIIKQRSTELIELGKQKKAQFYRQAMGQQVNVLFEEKKNAHWMYGFSENYIRVRAPVNPAFFNKIIPVKVNDIQEKYAIGDILV